MRLTPFLISIAVVELLMWHEHGWEMALSYAVLIGGSAFSAGCLRIAWELLKPRRTRGTEQ